MAHIADRIGKRDKACIKAFLAGRACEGYKLRTDGHRLDGIWTGGSGIATREHGKVAFHDLGSKAAQAVQRAVMREMHPRRGKK